MSKQVTDSVIASKIYKKKNSFEEFHVPKGATSLLDQTSRALSILDALDKKKGLKKDPILLKIRNDLEKSGVGETSFSLTQFVADEMNLISDADLPRYLFHRYRYEIFPGEQRLDDYPPYLQLEPSSICNFRCVFCYQTDMEFSARRSGYMGNMKLDLFKTVIDQAEGNVEFLSFASRGEPLVNKDFSKMLEYCVGKFLNLKVNTNASLLTEEKCHALLSGGATTVVFSADAADDPLYSQLRVNGNLDQVRQNIENFQRIRETQYSSVPMISRVSGVMVDESQDMASMKRAWGGMVDQISFVTYNPWENVYQAPRSRVKSHCSDLWRRMFVWYDGVVNPCDTDYKSKLKVGNINDQSLSDIWRSGNYENLRSIHRNRERAQVSPCNRCVVV